jgi:hypothetical protein
MLGVRTISSLSYVLAVVLLVPVCIGLLLLSLLTYALVAELADRLFGAPKDLDPRETRAMAERLCRDPRSVRP